MPQLAMEAQTVHRYLGLTYRLCVTSTGFFKQEKRFNVFPRVCKTERTQIPMAACSRAFLVLEPLLTLRTFTVLRTFLIHEQSFLARTLFRVPGAILFRVKIF